MMNPPNARALPPTANPRVASWLLLLACALLLLPTLGLYPLFDVDEGAFSEATRELLQSGDWLSTTLNGLPRYDKPILIYWLQALSVSALGLNEFALRLPSALAVLAWILAIARFAQPRLGTGIALLAAWIAATSLGVIAMGRAAHLLLDGPGRLDQGPDRHPNPAGGEPGLLRFRAPLARLGTRGL